MKSVIKKLVDRQPITAEESTESMKLIMSGEATEAQIGAFIMGLRLTGETPEIIAACAEVMRAHATPIPCSDPHAIDIVGTGGDGAQTFNISTTAAFVIAGAGVTVAKHGSYGVSSRCGSANVLDQLGINLNYSPDQMARCLEEIGIAFLFAPALHPAMKHVVGPRRELGIWSLFNILGPLCNPASVQRGLTGVFKPDLLPIVAEASQCLNAVHQLIVHGGDGLDEITTTASTKMIEVKGDALRSFDFHPDEWNLPLADPSELTGGEPEENAAMSRAILSGELQGAKRDIVLVNAAFTLYTAGVAETPKEGFEQASESIDSGQAAQKLAQLAALSQGE